MNFGFSMDSEDSIPSPSFEKDFVSESLLDQESFITGSIIPREDEIPSKNGTVITEIALPIQQAVLQDIIIETGGDEAQEISALVNTNSHDDNESSSKKTRKRVKNPKQWKKNVRKTKYQAGEAHTNSRGKQVAEKQIKNTTDCVQNCKFKCSLSISEQERALIFENYYKLNQDGKDNFLARTTVRYTKKRSTASNSRRQFSFAIGKLYILHYFVINIYIVFYFFSGIEQPTSVVTKRKAKTIHSERKKHKA